MRPIVAVLVIVLAAVGVFGQTQQSAPTLKIVTEDPNLPSELYYGNLRVKPLRLRPGTNKVITIDDSDFFVQQHYIDFLGRMPEPSGQAAWLNILNNCAPGNTSCDRIEVSSGFFRSPEFQERGYFAYRFYVTALGRKPNYAEFIPDLRRVSGFQTPEQLEASRAALANDFTLRADFRQRYDSITDPSAYVNALETRAGVTLANKSTLIADLSAGRTTRAKVLRAIADSPEVYQKYYTQAFVVMQYFGYLRRDPDAFYLDWIRILNEDPQNYRNMINGFVNSQEYRNRF
ncbi:MAG TPA: DUF4214 domain-containing protein [Pyrinomonadaceae bacterium]|jgi:hypothetical protein|nr:DUF4214 domain-containing protein [Pyrinomonadaceae bacterium]